MELKKNIYITIFLCMVAIFCPSLKSYALMKSLNVEELTKESISVVRGKVLKTECYWNEDGSTIFTKARIKVKEIIKGEITPKIILVGYEGGEIDNVDLVVSDMPILTTGEEVIIFLEFNKTKNIYEVTGNAQGKFTIHKDGTARRSGFCNLDRESIIDEDPESLKKLIKKIKRGGKE